MGSITEGVLGGLQIANERKRTEQAGKQQDTANAFAVLTALQHNQDRLNELGQQASEAQMGHFKAASDAAVASQALKLAQQGGDAMEQQRAQAAYDLTQGALSTIDSRYKSLTQQQDSIRGFNDQLSGFMAKSALLQDIAVVKQQHIPAAMQPIPSPQQAGAEAGGAPGGESFNQPSVSLPGDTMPQGANTPNGMPQGASQAQPTTPPLTAPVTAAPAMGGAEAKQAQFQLKYVQDHVDPTAATENGAIAIHAKTHEQAVQLNQKLQQLQSETPFGINATVIDEEAVSNREAQREDRQAMAKKREADAANYEAGKGLETAQPLLQDVGITVAKDQSGAPHLVGPGNAQPSLVQVVPDASGDPAKATVTGAPQEKAATAISALAESATPESARVAVRDAGQGIQAYVEDLASHKDLYKRSGNSYTINLFGRDPSNATKLGTAIDRLGAKAGSKDVLPKLNLPDVGTAFFQWAQNGGKQPQSKPTKAGVSGDSTPGRNDFGRLIGFLSTNVDPKTGTLSDQDSLKILAAIVHPVGSNISHLKDEAGARALLLRMLSPTYRSQVDKAIKQF